MTSHVSSPLTSFESRKSFQIHIYIILKQFLNTPLHLSSHEKLRFKKSDVFSKKIYVFGKSPKISPKGSHDIIVRHLRFLSDSSTDFRKTSRTPFGRSCGDLMFPVAAIVLRVENHFKFIFASFNFQTHLFI